MTSSTPTPPGADPRRTGRRRGFTLIELILVMTLLTIAAALVAPSLSSFFRSRTLDHEARRILALCHQGRSRAVAEGIPIELWIDPSAHRYGLGAMAGFLEDDPRSVAYDLDADVTLSTQTDAAAPAPYEETDVDAPPPTAAVIFTPDGQIAATSVARIVLRQGEEQSLSVVRNRFGTGFELDLNHVPATP